MRKLQKITIEAAFSSTQAGYEWQLITSVLTWWYMMNPGYPINISGNLILSVRFHLVGDGCLIIKCIPGRRWKKFHQIWLIL